MRSASETDDTEHAYRRTLEAERRSFAWVLRTYGGQTPARARAEALARYPYEPPGAPYRGLIFHDEAWHWAMLHLHGEGYWRDRPDLARPPGAYRAMQADEEARGASDDPR